MKKAYFQAAGFTNGAVKGFAHRGCDLEKENTLAAFASMVELGYRYLETDVHVTKDGKLVCFHDFDLDRVTTGYGPISEHTWAELNRIRIDGEPMLLFEELLKAFPDRYVNVDLKDERSSSIIGEIMARNDALERVLVSSIEDQHRDDFFALHPQYRDVVASSCGRTSLTKLWLASRFGTNAATLKYGRMIRKRHLVDAAQIPLSYKHILVSDRRFVRYCQALGLEVHVWTIDDPQIMEDLIQTGVDGIMTDDGPTLAKVLDRHGYWPQ